MEAEQERIESTMLPEVIKTVGHVAVAAGIAGLGVALTDIAPWLFTAAVSSLLSAPFLYGFADIVLSLRRLCQKS